MNKEEVLKKCIKIGLVRMPSLKQNKVIFVDKDKTIQYKINFDTEEVTLLNINGIVIVKRNLDIFVSVLNLAEKAEELRTI